MVRWNQTICPFHLRRQIAQQRIHLAAVGIAFPAPKNIGAIRGSIDPQDTCIRSDRFPQQTEGGREKFRVGPNLGHHFRERADRLEIVQAMARLLHQQGVLQADAGLAGERNHQPYLVRRKTSRFARVDFQDAQHVFSQLQRDAEIADDALTDGERGEDEPHIFCEVLNGK